MFCTWLSKIIKIKFINPDAAIKYNSFPINNNLLYLIDINYMLNNFFDFIIISNYKIEIINHNTAKWYHYKIIVTLLLIINYY